MVRSSEVAEGLEKDLTLSLGLHLSCHSREIELPDDFLVDIAVAVMDVYVGLGHRLGTFGSRMSDKISRTNSN